MLVGSAALYRGGVGHPFPAQKVELLHPPTPNGLFGAGVARRLVPRPWGRAGIRG
jgi:hypothetical protein